MRLQDINALIRLRDQLETINKQLNDLWRFRNDATTSSLYGSRAADQAEGAAKKAIRASLLKQRNSTLEALQRFGITIEEES